MTNILKKLIETTLTTGANTVYTAPTGTDTMFGYISLTNQSASPVDVDVKAGSGPIFIRKAMTIEPDETKEFYGPLVLESGDVIEMTPSAAGDIDVYAAGYEDT